MIDHPLNQINRFCTLHLMSGTRLVAEQIGGYLRTPFGCAAWGAQSHRTGQSRSPLARRMIVRICESHVFGVSVSPMLRR